MVAKRAHTTANIAPCLVTFGKQVNAAYPKRDKRSDGIWPSPAHTAANPNSDHEAGNAKDIDDDLLPGNESAYWDVWSIALTLASVRDPRGKYLIHDDRFFDFATGKWRGYMGSNPHRTHLHLSVHEHNRNDARPWVIAPAKPLLPNQGRMNRDASVHRGYHMGIPAEQHITDLAYKGGVVTVGQQMLGMTHVSNAAFSGWVTSSAVNRSSSRA